MDRNDPSGLKSAGPVGQRILAAQLIFNIVEAVGHVLDAMGEKG